MGIAPVRLGVMIPIIDTISVPATFMYLTRRSMTMTTRRTLLMRLVMRSMIMIMIMIMMQMLRAMMKSPLFHMLMLKVMLHRGVLPKPLGRGLVMVKVMLHRWMLPNPLRRGLAMIKVMLPKPLRISLATKGTCLRRKASWDDCLHLHYLPLLQTSPHHISSHLLLLSQPLINRLRYILCFFIHRRQSKHIK